MLLLSLVLLAGLAVAIRNAYGLLAVAVTAAAVTAVGLFATAMVQAGFGYALTWFLLLGGVRPVAELQRERRRSGLRRSDADQLARLTRIPGGAWVTILRAPRRRRARSRRPLAGRLTADSQCGVRLMSTSVGPLALTIVETIRL